MSATTVTARPATDHRGLPRDDQFIVSFYTEDTHKGVARRLRSEIREWSKWFKSCGAVELSFIKKRAQYHQVGALTLGTFWKIRVTV